MSAADCPRPPKALAAAGRALWRRIASDLDDELVFDGRDLLVLERACRLADRMVALEDSIVRDGAVGDTDAGPRLNPAVTELRQSDVALMRLLSMLDLDDDAVPQTPTARRARRAAQTRWAGHQPHRSRS